MIYVVATFQIRPGTLEAFVEAAYVLIDAARREPGCIYHDLHASVTDPDRVVCIEQWADRSNLDTHLASPHTVAFSQAIEPLVTTSKVEIIYPERVELL